MSEHDPTTPAAPLSRAPLIEHDDEHGHASVVVGAYPSSAFASMVQARLEGEGIASRLVDAETTAIAPHLALALDGVKVAVSELDAARARAILDEIERGALVDHDDEGRAIDEEHDDAPRATRSEADRALGAALLGATFFPPAALYSIALAFTALKRREKRGRALVALVIDTLVVAVWAKLALGFLSLG